MSLYPPAIPLKTGTLTDAASISWDVSTAQIASVTLGGNRVLANPTNIEDGGIYILEVTQDSTGGRSLAFGTAYKFGTTYPISTRPGVTSTIIFRSDGTNMNQVSADALGTLPDNTHSLLLASASTQNATITDAAQTGLDITGDITIECWVRFTTLPTTGNTMWFGGKYSATGNQRSWLFGLQNTSGTYYLRNLLCPDGITVDSSTHAVSVSTATWYHYAFTYDVTIKEYNLYLNGVRILQSTRVPGSLLNSSADFEIGSGNSSSYLNGNIDEFRAWDIVRSPIEIAQNYNRTINGSTPGLQGYWRFNNDATDATPNGNDLTLNNAPTYSTSAPF